MHLLSYSGFIRSTAQNRVGYWRRVFHLAGIPYNYHQASQRSYILFLTAMAVLTTLLSQRCPLLLASCGHDSPTGLLLFSSPESRCSSGFRRIAKPTSPFSVLKYNRAEEILNFLYLPDVQRGIKKSHLNSDLSRNCLDSLFKKCLCACMFVCLHMCVPGVLLALKELLPSSFFLTLIFVWLVETKDQTPKLNPHKSASKTRNLSPSLSYTCLEPHSYLPGGRQEVNSKRDKQKCCRNRTVQLTQDPETKCRLMVKIQRLQ